MKQLPEFYDPESMTFQEQEEKLKALYKSIYPWHGTEEANSYDYPSFSEAVRNWANDDFYVQHLTAKLYCNTVDWMFDELIPALSK